MSFDNKRGQEGITLTTILLLVLGVVVVILVILFATGFFDRLGDATGNLPGSLQAAVSACEVAGENGFAADYCATYRKVEINGEEQYQTCLGLEGYIQDNKQLEDRCATVSAPSAETFCESENLDKDVLVGTIRCSGDYNPETVETEDEID